MSLTPSTLGWERAHYHSSPCGGIDVEEIPSLTFILATYGKWES